MLSVAFVSAALGCGSETVGSELLAVTANSSSRETPSELGETSGSARSNGQGATPQATTIILDRGEPGQVSTHGLAADSVAQTHQSEHRARNSASIVTVLDQGDGPLTSLRLVAPDNFLYTARLHVTEVVESEANGQIDIFGPATVNAEWALVGERNMQSWLITSDVMSFDVTADRLTRPQIELIESGARDAGETVAIDQFGRVLNGGGAIGSYFGQNQGLISHMVVPLPDQPIALGGSWKVISDLHVLGVVVEQVTTYTLESLNGSVIGLAIEVSASQPQEPTRIDIPVQLEDGAAPLAEVTDWSAEGSGTAVVDLAFGGAKNLTLEIVGRQVFELPDGSAYVQRVNASTVFVAESS